MFAGYLMESGYWAKIRTKFNKQITTINNLCKITLITLVSILLLQKVLYDLLPLTSAIESSLFPSLLSIQFCTILLDDSFNDMFRRILSLNIWKPMRNLVRVSSVFHAIVLTSISMLMPLTSKDILSLIIHMSLTVITNFVICWIIHWKLEKPIIEYSMIISTYF